jgi:cytochrome c-type biogenesis protein
VVFTAATVAVLGLSDVLLVNQALLQRLDGVVTIVMGLVFLGVVPVLQRGMRVRHTPHDGLWGAPLLGAVYGLGWTPCLGPTLAGVITLAAGTQIGPTTGRGLLLIGAYCLGLGLPFVALALGARLAAPPHLGGAHGRWGAAGGHRRRVAHRAVGRGDRLGPRPPRWVHQSPVAHSPAQMA